MISRSALLLLLVSLSPVISAAPRTLDAKFHHIRNAEPREWSHFPEKAEATEYRLVFDVQNPEEYRVLTLRQQDTKQSWKVELNGQKIGVLPRDHNHLEHGIAIPDKLLKETGNEIVISTDSEDPDDIHLGDLAIHETVWDSTLAERAAEQSSARGYQRALPGFSTSVSLQATDAQTGEPIPCRFTVLDSETGALVLIGAESTDNTAVREGVVYSLDGKAKINLAGTGENPRNYVLYGGRGFEYSIAKQEVTIDGSTRSADLSFAITREVETPGLVACDTHLHTFEFDRHGDCTLTERIVSVAGEGIELPISTGHDKHIDYAEEAARIGADRWMTTVPGCEVTTRLGHFNTFPVAPGSEPAQHKLRPWSQIFQNIFSTPGVRVCILNHGRDIHGGFTPLAPENFDATNGIFKDGRILEANAMELINSGAQQTDPMQLVRDWMALLKSGHRITGIGCSDSHTVNFAIPGQARTYIECEDGDPSDIDIEKATDSLLAGNASASFGLLTLTDLSGDSLSTRVMGPGWTSADRLQVFRNGELAKEVAIDPADGSKAGEKYSSVFSLTELNAAPGDFLVAVASGPGITEGWWPMMPPYQPDSPTFEPFVMGISRAIWVK